jgi:uncharacterized membrane protein YphA (DoxX/SURF4 family)
VVEPEAVTGESIVRSNGLPAAWTELIFRVALGGIFLISGLAKISDQVRFLLTLRAFKFFFDPLLPLGAIVLPWLEFLLGFFLLVGLMTRTSALMISALNLVFTAGLLSVVVRGMEVDCGCFGLLADWIGLPDQADMKSVVRNLIFAAMGVQVYRGRETPWTLERYLGSREKD